jgi:drug/metabolite transporter (DMT)-like permease
MSPRNLVLGIATGALVLLLAPFVGGSAAELAFASATVLFPALLIALATRRHRARLRPVVTVLALVLLLSAIGIVLWPAGIAADERPLGLPAATWLMLAGLGLVPFVLVQWAYAATFDRRPDRDD